MGQQPSTAGKMRKKPKKAVATANDPANLTPSLYDDDEEEKTIAVTKTGPSSSPTEAKRKLSKDPTNTNTTTAAAAATTPKQSLPHSPKKPIPPSDGSPRKAAPSPSSSLPVEPSRPPQPQQPFVEDSSNPFCAPLDHIREEERPFHHLASISHFDVPTLRKLHSIFTDISASSTDDGIIDAQELTQAMGLTKDCLLARAIFRIFDITQTKRINFRTWVTTLSALSPYASLDEKIRFSFSLYDVNSDGSIDINELRSLLAAAVRENVLDLTEQQVQSICDHTLQNVDRDGNGTVEYEEYRQVVMGSRKFMDSFTLNVGGLLESFRVKKGKEVTEEEARVRRSRFRGKADKGDKGMGGGGEGAKARTSIEEEEDGINEEERKEGQARQRAAELEGKGQKQEKGKGDPDANGRANTSVSLTSDDPAALAIQALHDV